MRHISKALLNIELSIAFHTGETIILPYKNKVSDNNVKHHKRTKESYAEKQNNASFYKHCSTTQRIWLNIWNALAVHSETYFKINAVL